MSKKLLLADDSITIQKVIGITFANEDYELAIVDNGDAALEKAHSVHPDLILADVVMPGKNGYELCTALKGDPELRGIPILLLSGTFEPFDEDRAVTAGADSWIAKPFESQALIDRVEELLAKVPEPVETAAPAPSEPAPEPPAPEFESEETLLEADLWDELEPFDDLPPEQALETAEEPFGAQEKTFSDTAVENEEPAEEDIWGPVSFGEDDLGPAPVEEAEEEDIWGDADFDFGDEEPLPEEDFAPVSEEESVPPAFSEEDEENFLFEEEPVEEPVSPEPADSAAAFEAGAEESFIFEEEEPGPEVAWEDVEEEILPLGEDDILAEEELAPLEEAAESVWPENRPGPSDSSAEFPLPPAAEASPEESAPVEVEGTVFEEEFSLVEEGPEWDLAEETPSGQNIEPAVEEPPAAPVEGVGLPETPPAPLAQETVAAQARGLSEEELSRIVEGVAGSVIEKLAGTILEKIAWEVVPDLAENLVREEIRKIKAGAR